VDSGQLKIAHHFSGTRCRLRGCHNDHALAEEKAGGILMSRPKLTVLCIDDHWNALIARKMLLEQQGYRVFESIDGDEGLKLFCMHAVNAVVLDYQMPGMSGDMIAHKMKSLKAEVPILLLSSYGPLPQKKLRSVDMFLLKSQETKLLVSSLRKLLSKPKPFFHRWLDDWRGRNRTVLP
jgi:CheY-like chemotaxis protein